MEAMRCIRVDRSLAYLAPVSRNDFDSRPTKPFPGKLLMRPCLKRYQHLSQVRVKYPSSLQQTSISPDTLREHQYATSCPRATGNSPRVSVTLLVTVPPVSLTESTDILSPRRNR